MPSNRERELEERNRALLAALETLLRRLDEATRELERAVYPTKENQRENKTACRNMAG